MVAGIVMPFAGSTVPQGYLLCDGSAVSRTDYATLYAVVGDTYGAGDGSTTFNLPDMSGRVVLGQSSNHTIGSTGGSVDVTLTSAQIAQHTHNVPQHGHQHTIKATTPSLSHSITHQPAYSYSNPTKVNGGTAIISSQNRTAYTSTTTGTASRATSVAITAHAATNCTMSGGIADKEAFDTTASGADGAHNNMQPYMAVTYIISTGNL